MPQAFISYSRKDATFVSQLQAALHAFRFDTWRDVHNLRAGDRWPRKLGEAINVAPVFILIWSANAASSDFFVELEWTTALALKRNICIVALDQSLVAPILRAYEPKCTTDAAEAAGWLLDDQSTAPAPPPSGAQSVLAALSATPDTVTPKQLAQTLTITFLSQTASVAHGNSYQSAGPMTVYQASPPASSPAVIRNNISSRGNLPFVGRQDLLAELDSALENARLECVVVLHGIPGVGKSELAREYARLRRYRYPGGTFSIDASANAFALQLAALGEKQLALPFPPDLSFDDRGQRTFLSLGQQPVLLIYDNVVSFELAKPWLPYSGMPCHILITTFLDSPTYQWSCLEVHPLTPTQSLELVDKLTEGKLDRPTAQSVAAHSGGLPVQILPHAAALQDAKRHGHPNKSPLPIVPEADNSFRAAYSQLDASARLLLHAVASFNTQHIPSREIAQHLMQALEWTEPAVERAFDRCVDLHLLQDPPDPRMHQLFAAFIRQTRLAPEDQTALTQVTAVQAKRFLDLAEKVSANPADLEHVTLLLDYPLASDRWIAMGASFTLEEGELVGSALRNVGRFDEAWPWFERALAEKEKGNVHGLVDHQSLGSSLHNVGYCFSRTGHFEEARPWFERAVAAKEKGDVHGRIDHQSIGSSLHQVGCCFSSTGHFEEARPWFERAVAEAEKGDVHGRVDHNSLGTSRHQVGYCYLSMGRFEEARTWFERGVAEAEKGDVHGRVNHQSLGISLYQVGYCYSSTGHFEEARPWFERAAAEAEKGDVHGRVDHESLGTSLHQVGYCYSSTGHFEEARPWFERAAAEAEKGDVHGRVDHQSLGISLHQVGDCYSSTGHFEEARPWFERAVAEKEKGDVHGRVDHQSLGISLHQVGYCYSRRGRFEEARPWFQRAVAEAEKGDLYGRVHPETVTALIKTLVDCLRQLDLTDEANQWDQRRAQAAGN